MDPFICVIFITISIWQCDGVSLRDQLEHIAESRMESQESIPIADFVPSLRRLFDYDPGKMSVILGAPSMVSHLPAAEPILPGHTLIRPSVGMLKSSVKFPHKDMDDGAGVYGNIDNLGLKWDGRSERVLYSGFRRLNDRDDVTMTKPEPPRSNDEEETSNFRLLLALLRGDYANKKVKTDKFKKISYKSIYPYKEASPIIIIVPQISTKNINQLRIIMDNIGRQVGKKVQQKVLYIRTSKNKRKRRPRVIAPYLYLNLETIDKVVRSEPMPARQNNLKDTAVVVLKTSDEDFSDDDDGNEEFSEEEVKPQTIADNVKNDPKLTWFWNSKDRYNHIKISPEAPELYELMPVVEDDNSKKWWFYHQADYEPFQKVD